MDIIIVQPALPKYRIDFFERLYEIYGNSFKVYYSPGSLGALNARAESFWAKEIGPMYKFMNTFFWQAKAVNVKISRHSIVVLSGNPRQITTLLLLFKAKMKGAKVIWWSHYWSSTSRRWRQIIRFLPMKFSDAVLLYTDEEVFELRDDPLYFGVSRSVYALNNGINYDPIKLHREKYIYNKRENALLFIGRLTKKADLKLLFYAMAMLGDNSPKLYLIGSGEEENMLRGLAQELEIENLIHWQGALVEEHDISLVANRCKAFVYPGQVGLSLIHAMAYGLPCLLHSNRKLHMPEIAAFTDRHTGLAFENNSVESLANSIMTLLKDGSDLGFYSENAVNVLESCFSTEAMSIRFRSMIHSIMSDNN